MNIVLITTLLFIISLSAHSSCELVTFDKIIKINKTQDEKVIKKSSCDSRVHHAFLVFLDSASGKMNSSHLTQYFKNEYKVDVTFKPSSFEVLDIKELIQDNINNEKSIVKKVTSLIGQSSLTLNKTSRMNIECSQCHQAGIQNISMQIDGRKYWLNALIHIKRKSFVLVKSIMNLNQKLDTSYFKEKTILDAGNRPLFDDIKNIEFYRLTRYLNTGDTVGRSDLVPRVLIQYGQKVKIKFKNSNIQLNSTAIANGNGKFGDFIQVINPRSKKKIMAKVVGHNKAEIQ